MQRDMVIQLVVVTMVVLFCFSGSASVNGHEAQRGRLPQIPFYHKFSPQAKENAEKSGVDWVFPALNTPEYHQLLVHRDLVRHGRNLATAPSISLTFYLGNMTALNGDSLYYTLISVGTPSVSYFVALDTGSDLFWLPCECKACAPLSSPYFQELPSLNVYAPSKSNTSKPVTCGSTNCATFFSMCQDNNLPTSGQCEYRLAYETVNTTTSGTVYQDNIHMTPNNGDGKDITTPIVLGCGQTQTGSLVDGSTVPDGLIGLGRQPYSVPSLLAQSGLVGDSFSMCFSNDSSGRIVFGDFGGSAITTTPFQDSTTSPYPQYNIGLDSVNVGNDSIPVNDVSLFDTGTTMTFLTSTVYNAVIDSFAKQVTKYKRFVFDNMFEVCYQTSNSNIDVPAIDFEVNGAAKLQVITPFVLYFYASNNSVAGFCLGLLDGGSESIFGANFMAGYNFIFNRVDLTLGFEQSDCYTYDTSSTSGPALSPVRAPSPSATTPPHPVVVPPPVAPSAPGTSAGQRGGTHRTSVPLVSVLLLRLLVNFLLRQ